MGKNVSFENIMKEIVDNMPEGDDAIFKYLNEQVRIHKDTKYEKEIARACGRLLYEKLSPEARQKFDKVIRKDADGFEAVLQEIQFKIHQHEYDSAMKMLEETVEKYEKLDLYRDDKVSTYFNFEDQFQFTLYTCLNKPAKNVRQAQFDYSRLYFIYGNLLFELKRYKDALDVLEKAQRWNPVSPEIAFELAETCKAMGDIKGFYKHTEEIYQYLYKPYAVARYYRNLGYYYVEKQEYETAACCLIYSTRFESSDMVNAELYYIATKCDKLLRPTMEEAEKCFAEKGIRKAPSEDVLGISYSLGKKLLKQKQYAAAKYFLGVVFMYMDDEEIKNMIVECDANIK